MWPFTEILLVDVRALVLIAVVVIVLVCLLALWILRGKRQRLPAARLVVHRDFGGWSWALVNRAGDILAKSGRVYRTKQTLRVSVENWLRIVRAGDWDVVESTEQVLDEAYCRKRSEVRP
jgi:hypothetical protein